MDEKSNAEGGPVVPGMRVVPISGDSLAQERTTTHQLKTSNVVPVAKSSYGGIDKQLEIHPHGHGPGTAPDHVYEASMAWWRYSIRRFLVANLHTESRWIAAMQASIIFFAIFAFGYFSLS
jgi:hypothetical protein